MGLNKSSPIHPELKDNKSFALIIIDVQNDFCKGGALAVDDANDVIAPINKMRFTYIDEMPTILSQDYHPPNHMSFAPVHGKDPYTEIDYSAVVNGDKLNVKQTLWPKHCVKNTYGSDFHQDLIRTRKDVIVQKGKMSDIESYSAFGDAFKNKYERTAMADWLRTSGTTDIILTGIATDYCVYYTALDALRLGYKVHLVLSCTRGVAKDTTEKALTDMLNKGVFFYDTVDQFYEYFKSLRSN